MLALPKMAVLRRVSRNLAKLGRMGENTIFVSQDNNAGMKHASIVIGLQPNYLDQDDNFLKLRRLFKALEYRFNQEKKDYELKIDLKRKAKE